MCILVNVYSLFPYFPFSISDMSTELDKSDTDSNLDSASRQLKNFPKKRKGAVVMPRRPKNKDVRIREFLTESEVNSIQAASNNGRYGLRNATMVMMAFRHGLRVKELIMLRWEQVDLEQGKLYVKRVKNGIDSVHPLKGSELRALSQLKLERGNSIGGYVFINSSGEHMSTSNVRKMLASASEKAGLDIKVHPHMLRHACGYYLANRGEDTRAIQVYMGHASIQNTTLYTELSSNRFNNFFSD